MVDTLTFAISYSEFEELTKRISASAYSGTSKATATFHCGKCYQQQLRATAMKTFIL